MREKSEVVCPLHGNSDSVSAFRTFSYDNQEWMLYRCNRCKVAFYDPIPQMDYSTHTDKLSNIIDYAHLNANIEGMLWALSEAIPEGDFETFMEIGCGFGFVLSFVQEMFQMKAVGFEPSLYGEIGATELNIDIRRAYFSEASTDGRLFDIIFSSEVIEHSPDPAQFLSAAKKSLTDKGVLILTTPDLEKLSDDVTNPESLAMLSPGAHVVLYTKEGIQQLFRDAGFQNFKIFNLNTSLVIAASVVAQNWHSVRDSVSLAMEYYRLMLERLPKEGIAYSGLFYRLFRGLIDTGQYPEAERIIETYVVPSLPRTEEILRISNKSDIEMLHTACAAPLFYYLGIFKLNHQSEFTSAADFFGRAYELMERKIFISPESCVVEFQLLWMARFHQALALSYAGFFIDSAALLNEILEQGQLQPVHLPPVSEEIRLRSAELIKSFDLKIS